jgi:putative RNA 2'-phosphotransferase
MSTSDRVAHSRWLSWALRHEPAAAGIALDEAGWTPIAAMLAAAARQGHAITRAELEALVAGSDKQRFAISPDGLEIRANQGHSVPVDLGLAPQEPPERLFHGTADRFVAAILRDGLRRQARHHVHLSAERATAAAVGTRHGRLVVLVVAAGRMHRDGHAFFRSANGVWLAEAVPAGYLAREDEGQG